MKKYKNSKKRWTASEDLTLENAWGSWTMEAMIKKLGRSENQIRRRAYNLGLGRQTHCSDYLNRKVISEMLGVDSRTVKKWIEEYGLKAKCEKRNNYVYYKVQMNHLKKWLKDNVDKWNSNKLEYYALGSEDEWLKEKRKEDFKKCKYKKDYSEQQDKQIIQMYMLGYEIEEIAKEMKRSRYGIQKRLSRLREKGFNIPYKNPWKQMLKQAS